VLCRQLWLLPLVQMLLFGGGFRTTCWLLGLLSRPKPGNRIPPAWESADFAQRCAALTALAAQRGVVQSRCLPQALALQSVLHSRGLEAQLRIGVLPGSAPLQAHAWVELAGVALGTQPVSMYQIFEKLNVDELQLN
jgi:Transglutaminase-like superfamily